MDFNLLKTEIFPLFGPLLQRRFLLLIRPFYGGCGGFTSAPSASLFASFFDPSNYVVQLYKIAGGGDLPQSRELFPRFAPRQQQAASVRIRLKN